jgi:O-antigen/teichoic acid export membrane protein
MATNVGWLAGSRGFIGMLSVAYLAIAARALGPIEFGEFALVLTYGQLIANLVQFQSWKGVIRFGALHVAEGKKDALARLFGFTTTLDAASTIVGATLAIIGVQLAAHVLHWSPGVERPAAIFGTVVLLASGGTPSGMLRLLDRFDLQAYTEAVGPIVRLVGSLSVWATGGGVIAFLAVWGAAALGQTIAQWTAAVVIHGSKLKFGMPAFRQALKENHRLWRFMLFTNISNSLGLFWMQLGTLAVGAVAGPAEAGGFRIASRIAKGITKPVETVTRAIYPELARLIATDNHATARKVLVRLTWVAAGLALIVVLIIGFGGAEILHLIAGKRFEFAHGYLFLLSIAAAIDLVGFALEPFHSAHGRAGRVLRSRAIGALAYLVALAVMLPIMGPKGSAYASIGASLIILVQMAQSASQMLKRRHFDAPATAAD